MSQFITPKNLPLHRCEKEVETLQKQNRALSRQLFDLSTSQREKELALEEVHRLNDEIIHLNAEIDRIRHTCKLEIPDSWKIVYIVLPYSMEHALTQQARRPDGMVHIYVYDLARDVGKERQQTGAILKKMAEIGMIRRDAVAYVTANGQHATNIYVDIEPRPPVDIHKPKPANWGDSKRFTCPNCKHMLRKLTSYHCDNCDLDFDERGFFVEPGEEVS